jgi:quercetin dioxygenase-like cupin family protein
MSEIRKISWKGTEVEKLSESLSCRAVFDGTLAQLFIKRGGGAPRHSHASEEYSSIISGVVKYVFDDREVIVNHGEVLVVPPNVPHWVVALEDAVAVLFFSPARADLIPGHVHYLRNGA